MSDNTQINKGAEGDIIATDDLTKLNGQPVNNVKAQRVKVGYGIDGEFQDVGTNNPLPVGAETLPLPTGAATESKQNTGNASLSSMDSKMPTHPSTEEKQTEGNTSLSSIDSKLSTIETKLDNLQAELNQKTEPADTQGIVGDVSVSNMIPSVETGLAKEAGGNLQTIAGKDFAAETTLAAAQVKINNIKVNTDKLPSDPAREGGKLTEINTNLGSTIDEAITTDTTGSISGKIRGLVKIFADVWDSGIHALKTKLIASVSGGWTPYHLICTATNNATCISPTPGQIGGIQVFNNSANIGYLKLYDKASAPAPATDTPVKVILIPANTNGAGVVIPDTIGIEFTTGIALAVVAGIAGNDNTAVAASAFIVNIDYKI